MILVDTSIWVDHLRHGKPQLAQLLQDGGVLVHPMVIGELSCGHLSRRKEILNSLGELPQARQASHEEVLHMIDRHQLMGRGIGWVDAHLLASSLLSAPARLWTADSRLDQTARALGVA